MAFNLYSVLTEKDKTIMKNYIYSYGIREDLFIGLEDWLQNWGKSKIKLYKLLGNNLIYKVPYEYEEPTESLANKFERIMYSRDYFDEFFSKVRDKIWGEVPKKIEYDVRNAVAHSGIYAKNAIQEEIVLDYKESKKKVVLSKNMKPMKALLKFLKYSDLYDELKDDYEKFRLEHSRIFNSRITKGNLVISIHPMDFMTMSDNASNWSSCMSWSSADGGGCYKIGTVEMMNSNCVVCCYLESSNESFYFNSKDADHKWNNKKWRQLFYITKDIIVSGKPYPYNSEILTKEVLCLLQKLSKENLGVKYSFGPEVYMDMKTVYSEDDFEKAREDEKGKRILFDTKGMYNDMANDHDMIFTCVRNKIKGNKIINLSGKNPCLCCGDNVIEKLEYEDEYNDRYDNTGSLVCQSCIEDNFNCDECGRVSPFKKIYNVDGKRLCFDCATKFKRCPCGCGTILNIEKHHLNDDETTVCTYRVSDEYLAVNQRRGILQSYYHTSEQAIKNHGFCALYMCKDEAKRRIKAGELAKTSKVLELSKDDTPFYRYFSRDDDFFITKKSYDELNDDMKKFLIENLENAYKIEE